MAAAFLPLGDGRFAVRLPNDTRTALMALADQLADAVESDVPQTRRLFPTAYPNDPERDAGYQILARSELIDQRMEAISLLQETATKSVLTEDELAAWMAVVNDVRLVLGTTLDVSEDDDLIDPTDPDADLYLLYHQLGVLVHTMVVALTTALPEPTGDDAGPDTDPGRQK